MSIYFNSDVTIAGALSILASAGYLDMNKNEIRNFVPQKLASAPSSPVEGMVYYDTVKKDVGLYNGTAWLYSRDVDKLSGYTLVQLMSRGNHTGTQPASTISDFDTQVRTNRLDQMANPTTSVSMNTQKVINQADPTNAQDGATKSYVDSAIAGVSAGISYKDKVRVATAGNITLSGLQTIDGVSLSAGDRVLVWAQGTASQNGIYVVSSGSWTRSSDADTWNKLVSASIFVAQGTLYADKQFLCTSDPGGTLGTTSVVFINVPTITELTTGNGITKTGNQLSTKVDGTSIVYDGTGAMKTGPSVPGCFSITITGDGTTKNFAITHNLNSLAVKLLGYSSSNLGMCFFGYTITSVNVVTINLNVALANGVTMDVTVIRG